MGLAVFFRESDHTSHGFFRESDHTSRGFFRESDHTSRGFFRESHHTSRGFFRESHHTSRDARTIKWFTNRENIFTLIWRRGALRENPKTNKFILNRKIF